MMERFSNYAVIQFAAHPARNERLNVGLIIFHENSVDIKLSKRLDRIKALSAALDVDQVRDAILNLSSLDDFARTNGASSAVDRLKLISNFAPVEFSDLGTFDSHSSVEYDNAIASLLQKLIEPEPAPIKNSKGRSSPLLSSIKRAFRQDRILALKGEDIDSHRVVVKKPIVGGLEADLLLKNGSMHVIEAVDASNEDMSLRKVISDIAVSALVFEQARMVFGERDTRTKLVYQASASIESMATPALQVAEHQGAELINWESNDDRLKFLTLMTSLATPIPSKKNKRPDNIVGSVQHKFSLN